MGLVSHGDGARARPALARSRTAKGGTVQHLCLIAADRAIVVGHVDGRWSAWLHDGARWASERMPAGTNDAACAADGNVFALVGDAVQRRTTPDHREPLALPERDAPFVAKALWAGDSGALWVEAAEGGRAQCTLLRMPLSAAR